MLNCTDRKRYLRLWRRILSLVACKQVPKRQIYLVCPVAASWVVESSHVEGLRHVTEGFFHTLVSNLDCTPEYASSNPGGKGKEVRLFLDF